MTTLINRPNYQLTCLLRPQEAPLQHLWSLELFQRFPEAQRPRDQRILQLTLSDADLDRIAISLINRERSPCK